MLYEDSLYAVTCNVFTLRGFDDPKRRIKTTLKPVAGVPWSREAGVVGAVEIPFAGPSVCTALVLVGESQRGSGWVFVEGAPCAMATSIIHVLFLLVG